MARNLPLVVTLAIIALVSTPVLVMSQTVNPAPPCPDDPTSCELPNCRCSGHDIPGGLTPATTPQMVFITFDDAVTTDNFPFYQVLLNGRKNPNGHPITASFFISHEYTNYSMVHELWRNGHDIGLHSISHSPDVAYWSNLTADQWVQEIVEQREQMTNFARVPASDVKGIRAPLLQGGGDTMYEVLKNSRFIWECSRPTLNNRNPGLWPYTNDFQSLQECQIEPCPIGAYPGFWTVPMIDMIGDNQEGCAMVDTCTPVPTTADETYNLLYRNFQDHYTGNRAPFGIFAHHGWVNGTGSPEIPLRREGYLKFMDYLGTLNDTYIVGISRAVQWVQTPTPLANLTNFAPFQVTVKPNACTRNYSCLYRPEQTPIGEERYLHSCVPCPVGYPWVGNHLGRNPMP